MASVRRSSSRSVASGVRAAPVAFVSAEAFDSTGILVGMDPSASCYWWLPDLGAPAAVPERSTGSGLPLSLTVTSGPVAAPQAARRAASSATAAA
ncbi:MAG: hypothetical protein FJ309_08550 [Planctomycetes bacterium]|nr:hypothetical protein [Planctomycetota bacterium]